MEYLSFDLRLTEWNPHTQTGVAEVLASPAGEGERYSFLLDVTPARSMGYESRTPVQAAELGRRLAEGVFAPETWAFWRESYQIAQERGRGLRLRLHIDAWELTRLPWELLYDAQRGDFLVFDRQVSLVRYLRLHATLPTLRQSQSLKVLVVISSPLDQAALDSQSELTAIKAALGDLANTGAVELAYCDHATRQSLHDALIRGTPDVLHYIGHSTYDREQRLGMLLLENEKRLAAPLAAPDAARLLHRYGVNLVVLNACESAQGAWAGLAPALVRAETPAVVAMQWPVEDQSAIRFSRQFYQALSLGKTVDECVAEGRLGAHANSSDPSDWAAPVLFLRSLSGRLWTDDLVRYRDQRIASPIPRAHVPRAGEVPGPMAVAEEGLFRTHGPLHPVADAELLAERPELQRLVRLAQQPSVTQYVALLSARQTGKTTMLFSLMHQLRERYGCVFIDLAVLRAQNVTACYRYVAFRLVSEFRSSLGNGAFFPERPQLESSVDFIEFLRELADSVPLPRILVLFDEVGALSADVSDGFFNTVRTIFSQGRGLSYALSKYMFFFSGAIDLYALTSGTNSPLNICEKLYLRDLEATEVHRIAHALERLGLRVSDDIAAHIFEWTSGHPYLTMRLCALLERAHMQGQAGATRAPQALTLEAIRSSAEQMLFDDDNIHHVIHELERRPLERRRLMGILEGAPVPFSRNDPVLASLEMIGVIRTTQPCAVRNLLYEQALLRHFPSVARQNNAAPRPAVSAEAPRALGPHPEVDREQAEGIEAMYLRVRALREEALDDRGLFQDGPTWEMYAAALFSMVPAFSIYPDLRLDVRGSGAAPNPSLQLGISDTAVAGEYWRAHRPKILVLGRNLTDTTAEALISDAVQQANVQGTRLVLCMTAGDLPQGLDTAMRPQLSGTRGDVTLVALSDEEMDDLLAKQGDLDALLRNKILEARLRKI